MFYKWKARDFETIPAYELEKGDEISYGHGSTQKYGAIRIDTVSKPPGAPILIQYLLPVGALAQSSETNDIAIFWEGKKPLIQINQLIPYNHPIMIRKK